MRRELVALLPLVGLSAVFVVNQSCATKSALEETEKELEKPKENIAEAKENLKAARANINDARSLLERAKQKLAEREKAKEEETQPVVTQEAPEETAAVEYKTWKVGWCDTLWDISAKVYDNSLYWPAIYDLNRDKVGSDPWILTQGTVLKYKAELSEEEKRAAVKEAIEWDLKFRDRPRSPKCPPK
ncbi:LysM peptidoglycan-binding domain-containing protein [Hydrogenivirga sp.]